MQKARARVEQLARMGRLKLDLVRRDLKTIAFLEAHPQRHFPETPMEWVLEFLRSVVSWGPVPYYILRAQLLEGRSRTAWRAEFWKSMIFAGAAWLVLFGIGMMFVGMSATGLLWQRRWPTEREMRGVAAGAPLLLLGSVLFAGLLSWPTGRELRSLVQALEELENATPESAADR